MFNSFNKIKLFHFIDSNHNLITAGNPQRANTYKCPFETLRNEFEIYFPNKADRRPIPGWIETFEASFELLITYLRAYRLK